MERIFPSKVCVSSLGAFDHSHIEHVQYVVLPHVHVAFRFLSSEWKIRCAIPRIPAQLYTYVMDISREGNPFNAQNMICTTNL